MIHTSPSFHVSPSKSKNSVSITSKIHFRKEKSAADKKSVDPRFSLAKTRKRIFIKHSNHVTQLPDRMLKCGKMESNENFIFSQPNASRFKHQNDDYILIKNSPHSLNLDALFNG